ncbi:MAG TPA: hypothetical protein VJ836_01700 [Candidatus Saccharimonadales bacterium]|nr:hypothetical protein [Candidatus Saccharimonadales bacterium]
MSGRLTQPAAVIEGRTPLPAHLMPDGLEQVRTRQTELPIILARLSVDTLFVDAQDPATYEESGQPDGPAGRIKKYTPYRATEPVNGILECGSYAWRLRDITWPSGDPAAYRNGDGYNSARYALRTRMDVWHALQGMGLESYGIETITELHARDWAAEQAVFLKPDTISDISDINKHPGTRAHLVTGRDLEAKLAEITFAGGAVLQQPEPLLVATDLMAQLGIETDNSKAGYLHAIRVFSLAGATPAIELRLTNPKGDADNPRGDIGKLFATELHLLPPEQAFGRLPAFAAAHTLIRNAFAARYGEDNYFAFDYIIRGDGSVGLGNALLRALTPNVPNEEGLRTEAGRLAIATIIVEAEYLARKAEARFNA